MNLMLNLVCLFEVWFIFEQSAFVFSKVVLTECHCCMQGLAPLTLLLEDDALETWRRRSLSRDLLCDISPQG